jgi:CRP/FNR family transcriptional regulator
MTPDPDRRCAGCRNRSSGLLCGLSGRALERLDRERGAHRYRRGQAIFTAGTPLEALYVIRSGRVKVYRTWHDGEEQVLRLLGPGEIFGYRPLFAGEPSRASAEAVVDSEICVVPRATVHELVRGDAELALQLLAKLARELRISESLMMDLVRRPVRQRVARLLLTLLADNRGARDPAAIVSRELMRKDMARMVGTTPETFSRVLRAIAQAGAVSLTRDRIRVRDEAVLRRIAGERAVA